MDKPINELTDLEFINFDDFAKVYEFLDFESHAIVHGSFDTSPMMPARKEEFYIMSALIGLDDIQKYLKSKKYCGYPFNQLGDPQAWVEERSDGVQFDLGQRADTDGIKAHYFVRRYQPNNMEPPRFPVTQSFIFYHKLSEEIRKDKRLFVDKSRDEKVIVERPCPGKFDGHVVRISRSHLREYLAVRKMALAVWVSVERHTATDLKSSLKDCRKDPSTYLQVLNPSIGSCTELICKTVIKPYEYKYKDIKWSKRIEDYTSDARNKPHIPFIVGIDKRSGAEVLSKKVGLFQPLYFKKDVLARYIEDKRSVVKSLSKELGEIRYLDNEWRLTYGINFMDRLVVLHKHLDRELPNKEKTYWKYFNVPPEGSLPKEFSRVYIDGKPPDSISLEEQLLELRAEINELFKNLCGRCVFNSNEDDDSNIQSLHVVIGEGSTALKPQILALSKLFVDSIDKDAVIGIIKNPKDTKDGGGRKLNSIKLLQNYYKQQSGAEYHEDILKLIWALRCNYVHTFKEKTHIEKVETLSSTIDPMDANLVYALILEKLISQLSCFKAIVVVTMPTKK